MIRKQCIGQSIFSEVFKICTYEISGTVLRNNGKENIGRSKIKSTSNFQVTTTPGGGGGGGCGSLI